MKSSFLPGAAVAAVALVLGGACANNANPGADGGSNDPNEATRDGGTPVLGANDGDPVVGDGGAAAVVVPVDAAAGGTTGCSGSCVDAGSTPSVQFLGRFDTRDPLGPKCGWPGCRIRARFIGTSVSVRMNEIDDSWMEGAPSEWDVEIDGVLQPKIVMTAGSGTQAHVLAQNLTPNEPHLVELYKRSEAQNGTTQFIGYDFPNGTLLSPPLRRARRVELIGDSAAAGFGVEGVGLGPDCPGADHAARWQNFHKSLGARLGEGLDAELAGTVYSGKGIAKNIWHPDKETMPLIFGRALPIDPTSTWDFTSYVPDAVVVMMGGNDFAVGQPVDEGPATLAQFTNAYDGLVIAIRQQYPTAHVFLSASPSTSDASPAGRNTRTNVLAGIQEVITRRTGAGDAKVYVAHPSIATASELTGCNGHGNPQFHQRVADELAVMIRAKTGW